MARNLVKEKEAKKEEPTKELPKLEEPPKPEGQSKVQVVTDTQLLDMKVDLIATKMNELYDLIKDSFKQVGVEFKDK